MNSLYEIVEKIHKLDRDASVITQDQRAAHRELSELSKKAQVSEDILQQSRQEMNFNEGELRRLYKRLDGLDDRKSDRSQRLLSGKNDEDHRYLKRDLDFAEKEIRDVVKRTEEIESKLEQSKTHFYKAQKDLVDLVAASESEKNRAQAAEDQSLSKLEEINKVRETYLNQLDDRFAAHYSKVSKVTRNPMGPICHVVSSSCGNCRLQLSPQILNMVIKGQTLEFCPNCFHILLPEEKNI